MRTALGPTPTLTIDISNNTSAGQYRTEGYDLAAIGQAVDQIVLMAYDEHGPWENTPGPVGSLSWQRTGLAVLLRAVPAAKVDLGDAGYGYAWRPHSNVMLSDAGARALVARYRVHARWVARVGEWTARLPDGSVLWWSDARSFALRVAMARADGLHGLAVWSLGLSDALSLVVASRPGRLGRVEQGRRRSAFGLAPVRRSSGRARLAAPDTLVQARTRAPLLRVHGVRENGTQRPVGPCAGTSCAFRRETRRGVRIRGRTVLEPPRFPVLPGLGAQPTRGRGEGKRDWWAECEGSRGIQSLRAERNISLQYEG